MPKYLSKFTYNQQYKILQLYSSNISVNKIATLFNVDNKVISNFLQNNYISIRSKQEQNILNHYINDNVKKEICDFYLKNKSIIKTIKKFKLSSNTIKNILKSNNIKILTSSQVNLKFKNEYVFNTIDTHEKAYWLGFLAADGNLSKLGQLRLQLAEKDKQHLLKFYKFMGGAGKVSKHITVLNNTTYTGYSVAFKSKILTNSLLKHNIVPNKSLTLTMSEFIDDKYLPSYILGMFDGDGTIGFYNNKLQFGIISSKFIIQKIQEILISKCFINKTKLSRRGKAYCLNYCGNQNVYKIMTYLYSNKDELKDILLERKLNIFNKYLELKNSRGF